MLKNTFPSARMCVYSSLPAITRDPIYSLAAGAAVWVLALMVVSALDERKRGRARTRKTD